MGQFPNVNVISPIDPIGANLVGNEVQRLGADTINKRNVGLGMSELGQRQQEHQDNTDLARQKMGQDQSNEDRNFQFQQQQATNYQKQWEMQHELQKKQWELTRRDNLTLGAAEAADRADLIRRAEEQERAKYDLQDNYEDVHAGEVLKVAKEYEENRKGHVQKLFDIKKEMGRRTMANEFYKAAQMPGKDGKKGGALFEAMNTLLQTEISRSEVNQAMLSAIAGDLSGIAVDPLEGRPEDYGQPKGLWDALPWNGVRKAYESTKYMLEHGLTPPSREAFMEEAGKKAIDAIANRVAEHMGAKDVPPQDVADLVKKLIVTVKDDSPESQKAAAGIVKQLTNPRESGGLGVSRDRLQALAAFLDSAEVQARIKGAEGVLAMASQNMGQSAERGGRQGVNIGDKESRFPEWMKEFQGAGARLKKLQVQGDDGSVWKLFGDGHDAVVDQNGKLIRSEEGFVRGLLAPLVSDAADGYLSPQGQKMIEQLRVHNPQLAEQFMTSLGQYQEQIRSQGLDDIMQRVNSGQSMEDLIRESSSAFDAADYDLKALPESKLLSEGEGRMRANKKMRESDLTKRYRELLGSPLPSRAADTYRDRANQ